MLGFFSVNTCAVPYVSNGTPTCNSQSTINFGTDVTYSGNTGYAPTGGDLTRTCQAVGLLTVSAPVCASKLQ